MSLARQVAEQALDARDVAHRFRKGPGELLDRRIAIELERVEIRTLLGVVLVPVEDHRLGFELELAQLLAEPSDCALELRQVELDRGHLLLNARSEDAHLA